MITSEWNNFEQQTTVGIWKMREEQKFLHLVLTTVYLSPFGGPVKSSLIKFQIYLYVCKISLLEKKYREMFKCFSPMENTVCYFKDKRNYLIFGIFWKEHTQINSPVPYLCCRFVKLQCAVKILWADFKLILLNKYYSKILF